VSSTSILGELDFDPANGLPQLAAGWESSPTDSRDLRLVQLHGPTEAVTLDTLRERDLEIVQYIHPFTYIVWGRTADLGSLSSLSAVRATTDFAPAFRVQPQWRQLGSAVQDVRVMIYRGANTDDVVKAIGRLGGAPKGRRVLNDTWEIAGFNLSGARIRAAARIPGVYSIKIQPTDGGLRGEMSDQLNVNNVDGGNIPFPGYETWLQSVGLDGTGVIMANVDGGVQDNHPDLVNRLIGCTGDTCGGSATSSHGTHTAGIMRHAHRGHHGRRRCLGNIGQLRLSARARCGARRESRRAGLLAVLHPAGRHAQADDRLLA